MTLRQRAYELAKSMELPDRVLELRLLIRDLTVSKPDEPDNDRGLFGYHARQLHVQTLGYLLVDKNLDQLPFKVAGLTEIERTSVEDFHRELVALNHACLAAAFDESGIAQEAADPYAAYDYIMPPGDIKYDYFGQEEAEALKDAFKSIPAVRQAKAILPAALASIPAPDYLRAVVQTGSAIERAGVQDAPDDIVKQVILADDSSLERQMFRHLAAMAAVRATLGTINQILYQRVLADHLPIITLDSALDILYQGSNVIGEGCRISYMITEEVGLLSPADLTLVHQDVLQRDSTCLCWVHGLRVSVSKESGEAVDVSMRFLDEHLNPYPGLTS